MSASSSGGMEARGRAFVDKHILRQSAPPRRPVADDPSITDAAAQIPAPRQPIMAAKPVGKEYAREFNEVAWRAEPGAGPATRANTTFVTQLLTEHEQKDAEITVGADGKFQRGPYGSALPDAEDIGYAMDADGRMVSFKEGGDRQIEGQTQRVHHSSVLGADELIGDDGKPVLDAAGKKIMVARPAASAGIMSFNAGRLAMISNKSGHYKPTVDRLAQAIEHLIQEGAFFRDDIVDAQGNPVPHGSDMGRVAEKVQKALAEMTDTSLKVEQLTDELATAVTSGDVLRQEAINVKLVELQGEIDQTTKRVRQAKDVLGKLGIGPSHRVSSSVAAEYVDTTPEWTDEEIKAAKVQSQADAEQRRATGEPRPDFSYKTKVELTGLELRAVAAKTMDAAVFARTGGGQMIQAGRKKAAVDELTPLTGQEQARIEALQSQIKDGGKLSADEQVEMASYVRRAKLATEVAALNAGGSAQDGEEAAERRSEAFSPRAAATGADIAAAVEGMGAQKRTAEEKAAQNLEFERWEENNRRKEEEAAQETKRAAMSEAAAREQRDQEFLASPKGIALQAEQETERERRRLADLLIPEGYAVVTDLKDAAASSSSSEED